MKTKIRFQILFWGFISCSLLSCLNETNVAKCSNNSDCQLGFACEDNQCIAACENESCCTSDTDCGEAQGCDIESGQCFDKNCDLNSDCPINQICFEFICVIDLDNDLDFDGVPTGVDNCPNQINPAQTDLDQDGLGDVCDEDDDEDGVLDNEDNCPGLANPEQGDVDQDGEGDLCEGDIDGDQIPDALDNCVRVHNPDQADLDEDGLGDQCDIDLDGDGIEDRNDNCVNAFNADQGDQDGDGIGDTCELESQRECGSCGVNRIENGEVQCFEERCFEGSIQQCENKRWIITEACSSTQFCSERSGELVCLAQSNQECSTNEECASNRCDNSVCTQSTEIMMTISPNDRDGDGVLDEVDLCPDTADPEQADQDGDGVGDLCDAEPTQAQFVLKAQRLTQGSSIQSQNGQFKLKSRLTLGSQQSNNEQFKLSSRITETLK